MLRGEWLTNCPIGNASIAQLVERDLAKVEVTSSNLVTRSNSLRVWRNGRVAMQRIANPSTSVRLRVPPPFSTLHMRKQPDARVVELVDTRDLKSLVSNDVPVQVRPRAPFSILTMSFIVF